MCGFVVHIYSTCSTPNGGDTAGGLVALITCVFMIIVCTYSALMHKGRTLLGRTINTIYDYSMLGRYQSGDQGDSDVTL